MHCSMGVDRRNSVACKECTPARPQQLLPVGVHVCAAQISPLFIHAFSSNVTMSCEANRHMWMYMTSATYMLESGTVCWYGKAAVTCCHPSSASLGHAEAERLLSAQSSCADSATSKSSAHRAVSCKSHFDQIKGSLTHVRKL